MIFLGLVLKITKYNFLDVKGLVASICSFGYGPHLTHYSIYKFYGFLLLFYFFSKVSYLNKSFWAFLAFVFSHLLSHIKFF